MRSMRICGKRSPAGPAIGRKTPGEIKLKDGTKLPFKLAMIAPPFKGVPVVMPLGSPRGFIPVDKNYRHTKFKNIKKCVDHVLP